MDPKRRGCRGAALSFLAALALAVPGRATFLNIDEFTSGPLSVNTCGFVYSYHAGAAILGGARETRVHDAHSCSLGGRAHLDIVTSPGYADAYGRTAANQVFRYGSFIGHDQLGWPVYAVGADGPNSALAAPLNLALTTDDKIQLDLLDFPDVEPYLYVQLHTSAAPWAFTKGYASFTVGTNLLSLSGFTDPWGAPMNPLALGDVDGILIGIYPGSNSATMSNDPGTGFRIDRIGIKFPVTDADGDGVNDDGDSCPATPSGEPVDANGCSASQKDADSDGVHDDIDQCPGTPSGETADANGCSDSQRDTDGDGVSDAGDECPGTASGAAVDSEGCSGEQNVAAECSSSAIWKNHGKFVSCVARAAEAQVVLGLLTDAEKDALVSAAAESSVGK